jgi:hypothetical protein
MKIWKKLAALATATVLATGLMATTATTADAKPPAKKPGIVLYDTGWP